jgi:hypothetical protein
MAMLKAKIGALEKLEQHGSKRLKEESDLYLAQGNDAPLFPFLSDDYV